MKKAPFVEISQIRKIDIFDIKRQNRKNKYKQNSIGDGLLARREELLAAVYKFPDTRPSPPILQRFLESGKYGKFYI